MVWVGKEGKNKVRACVMCGVWCACMGEGGAFLFLSATIRDLSCFYAMMSKNGVGRRGRQKQSTDLAVYIHDKRKRKVSLGFLYLYWV
jgi:hypothetical protein